MNSSALLHAINNIKDEYLTEADEPATRRSYKKQIFGISTAAALVLALVGGSLALRSQRQLHTTYSDNGLNSSTTSKDSDSSYKGSNGSSSEIATVLPWESLSVAEQYPELDFNNKKYTGRNKPVQPDDLGELLGQTNLLTGYDDFRQEKHSTYGEVFEIKGISSDCAVAVKHKDSEEYYVYVNSYYLPETLGQLIDDLSLEDNLIINSLWYEYTDENGSSISAQYNEPPQNAIWDMLLSDRNAQAVDLSDQPTWGVVTVMDMSIDIPILGYENISLSITEDGYLRTNILDTGKVFNIGVDAVNDFVSYVKENWDDIKTVQTNPDCLYGEYRELPEGEYVSGDGYAASSSAASSSAN